MQNSIGLTGYAILSVLNPDGSTARTYPPVKNLWLDQGLDALARVAIPEAFAVAAKGTSQDATKEVVHVSNTYTLAGNTVTRNTSPGTPRDFTADDVGKLMRVTVTPFAELMITAFTDATHVDVVPVGILPMPAVFSAKNIVIYNVQLTSLTNEAHLSKPTETISKTEADATITASGSIFSASDVGKAILVVATDTEEAMRFKIASYTSGTSVEVDSILGEFTDREFRIYSPQPGDSDLTPLSRTAEVSTVIGENGTTDIKVGTAFTGERDLKRTFIFAPEPENIEYLPSGDTTLTWTGTAVTRAAGTRNFTADDVGKYIKATNGEYAKITAFGSSTAVTVDRAPAATITATHFTLYGYNSYDGIAFSDSSDPADNINILIRLESNLGVVTPVLLLGSNPELPGQQLKVTYVCKAFVGPNTVSGTFAAPITDPNSIMSSSKLGKSAVEGLALASIDSSGDTQLDFAVLEPSIPGHLGISAVSAPSTIFVITDRTAGMESTPMEALGYTNGQFSQLYEGTFQINEANAVNWKTIGIYDPDTNAFAFVFIFNSFQKKTGEIVLVIRFRKTWNRDLS